MESLLLNYEQTLGEQLQHLIIKLVKQQVEEHLQHLQLPSTAPLVKEAEQTAAASLLHEKQGARKLTEEKLMKLIQDMTPGLKRRQLPLLIQARMLLYLYEHRATGIAPSVLFSYSNTGTVAGYRYVSFFKERGILGFIGARQNGKYILTTYGSELLEK